MQLDTQELVQHGGLGAVNTAAGFALSKGSIRLAQPALQYLDSPKEKICALGSCTPGKIAALAQHPRLGSLEHMVISSEPLCSLPRFTTLPQPVIARQVLVMLPDLLHGSTCCAGLTCSQVHACWGTPDPEQMGLVPSVLHGKQAIGCTLTCPVHLKP